MSGEHPTYGGHDEPERTAYDDDGYGYPDDGYGDETFPCPHCGAEQMYDQEYCEDCGEPLD